jgi:hypothetical protein
MLTTILDGGAALLRRPAMMVCSTTKFDEDLLKLNKMRHV